MLNPLMMSLVFLQTVNASLSSFRLNQCLLLYVTTLTHGAGCVTEGICPWQDVITAAALTSNLEAGSKGKGPEKWRLCVHSTLVWQNSLYDIFNLLLIYWSCYQWVTQKALWLLVPLAQDSPKITARKSPLEPAFHFYTSIIQNALSVPRALISVITEELPGTHTSHWIVSEEL